MRQAQDPTLTELVNLIGEAEQVADTVGGELRVVAFERVLEHLLDRRAAALVGERRTRAGALR